MRWAAPLLLLIIPGTASGEVGLTAAAFLQSPLGAAPAGMGGAFSAVKGSLDSLQYNPAALATLEDKTLTSTYLNGFGGAAYGFLGYGHPFHYGTLAASALYYNAGSIDLNLSNGTTGRVTAEEDTAWTASYAAQLLPGLCLGGTYRFIHLNLAQTATASTSQGDLGALWSSPVPGLSVGGALQFLGSSIRFESAGDPPPRTLRYGIAYRFPDLDPKRLDSSVDLETLDATFAADMVSVLHERQSPRLGMEFGLKPVLLTRVALRLGWVFNRDAQSFAFGAGVQQGRFALDYALGLANGLGNLQQITLSARF